VFRDFNGGTAGNVPGQFLGALLDNKTSKTAEIATLTAFEGLLYNCDEGFYTLGNINSFNSCFVGNLANQIGFGHGFGFEG
jgi:hypothetical protein